MKLNYNAKTIELTSTEMKNASMDLVDKVKDSIGTAGIMPLLAQYGANYLCETGYGSEDDMFVELLEAIKRIRKTI